MLCEGFKTQQSLHLDRTRYREILRSATASLCSILHLPFLRYSFYDWQDNRLSHLYDVCSLYYIGIQLALKLLCLLFIRFLRWNALNLSLFLSQAMRSGLIRNQINQVHRLNGPIQQTYPKNRVEHTDYREKFGRLRLSVSALKPFTQSCNTWLLSTTHSTDDG